MTTPFYDPELARSITETAKRLIRELHDELEREHKQLPGSVFFNLPRKRHHEIMGASRALKILYRRLQHAERQK